MSYNRKELKADTESKNIKKPKDVIYSLNGQWEYPGQVTKVPSNRITMKGIDYPVKGIDDLGNEIMMYPDNEYLFPGTSVTEYPMMKNGGWLDKYQYGGEGLTPERAKDMLSAGTSYGYPLTEKQIDFFSNIANVYVNEDGEVEEVTDDGYSNEDYGDFRRGGEKGLKRYTDKNIKSSINYLMERNETLFGPRGKRYYKPNQSNWLNKY